MREVLQKYKLIMHIPIPEAEISEDWRGFIPPMTEDFRDAKANERFGYGKWGPEPIEINWEVQTLEYDYEDEETGELEHVIRHSIMAKTYVWAEPEEDEESDADNE